MRTRLALIAVVFAAGLFGFQHNATAESSAHVYVDLGDVYFSYDKPYYRPTGESLAVAYYHGSPRYYRHGYSHGGYGYKYGYGHGYKGGYGHKPSYGYGYKHGYKRGYKHGYKYGHGYKGGYGRGYRDGYYGGGHGGHGGHSDHGRSHR